MTETPATPDPLHTDTRAITAGRADNATALAPVLWATSTFSTDSLDDARRRSTGARGQRFYSRYHNPTVAGFEHAIAELEGAEAALAFASGMGAVATTVPMPDANARADSAPSSSAMACSKPATVGLW